MLAAEIERFAAPAVEPGGVAFEGALAPALLRLSTASRVLVRLGEVEARDFATMVKQAKALPWRDYFSTTTPLTPRFAVTCRKCRLFHTGAIAERLITAMGGAAEGAPEVRVVVRGENDRFQISVDAGGEPMHMRGARPEQGAAPLRETLAAGILALAGWDPATPLVDPTCGAGTIPLEAARIARGRAAGARRRFAAERFPSWDAAAWQRAKQAVVERSPPAPIHGRDRDPRAIERARANALAADEDAVRWETIAVERSALPEGPPGLVIANPPYGERLPAVATLHQALGKLARSRPGWRLAVLTTGEPPGKWDETHPLVNGGLRVKLFVRD